MERSRFSFFGSFLSAALLVGTIALGGCSDNLAGTAPPSSEQTAVHEAQHNQTNDDSGSTEPTATHNTSNED